MRSLLLAVLLVPVQSRAASAKNETEGLFLDMSKLNLGTISSEDDKKKYIYTIQLEKSRVTRRTLKNVYENAFDLYKHGQYEAANDLTRKILSIDPGYSDASILNRATVDLKGSTKPRVSERRLIEERFEEGMALYRQGRLVEAAERWEECSKLAPGNLKSHYWLKKARSELAEEHYRKGRQAYRQHRLREALDQWYAALVLNPRYPRLTQELAKVEAESREQDANEKLQAALNLYSQGLVLESLKMLDAVLESGPGNVKAQKLQAEIRAEVANQHVAEGRRYYETRQYDKAVSEWKHAVEYGYDPKAADQLVARAKEQQRREAAARARAAEVQKQREEDRKKQAEEEAKAAEEAKKKEEEEKAKKEAEAKANPGGQTGATPGQTPGASTESNKQASQQAYLEGVIYYQKGDYEKARDKWLHAKQLDPSNADAVSGLEKIEKLYGAGQ
ncbi:MAG: tetratricopeptide repeat protein [Elusimicrobiota bacterium]|nr:MAG: tetratricopeptide repeat protein [Elusimicrobiota bacterium]